VSIGKFQEKFLGKGCATVIALACSFVFLFFGFSQCNRYSGMNGMAGNGEEQAPVAVKVGSVGLTTQQIENAQSQEASQFGNMSVPLSEQAQLAAAAVYRLVSQAAYTSLAEKDHVPITDDAILSAVQSQIQDAIKQKEMSLMFSGQVKDPKDLDAEFKKETGQTPADALKNGLTSAREALSDKDKRAQLVNDVAQDMVKNYYATKIAPSDQELRSSFDTYVTKRIFVVGQDAKADAKMGQVQAALKSGMGFEQAMDKFSDDPPIGKGKKISDNTNTVPASIIPTSPEYKELVGQKPGFVGTVQSVTGGKAIYKLVSVKSDLPKDFQTNLAKYKDDYAKKQADENVKKDVDALLAGPDVVWSNAGDKALFDFYMAAFANPVAVTDMNATMRKIADEGKDAAKSSDPNANEPGAYAWYLAFDRLYTSQGADKTKMLDERIDVLNALLTRSEDLATRLELVDLYIQKKDGSDAITQLIAASHANTDYSGVGTRQFGDLMAKRAALLKSGLVTEPMLKEFDAAQDQWRKDKVNADKEAEETKKQEAIEKAQEAENEKRNAAEVAKQKAEMEKNAPKTPAAPLHVGPKTSAPPGLLPPGTVKGQPQAGGSLLPPGTVPPKGPGG